MVQIRSWKEDTNPGSAWNNVTLESLIESKLRVGLQLWLEFKWYQREKQGPELYWQNIKHCGVLQKQIPIVYKGKEEYCVVYNLENGDMLYFERANMLNLNSRSYTNWLESCSWWSSTNIQRSVWCERTSSIRNIIDMPICSCCSINQDYISRVSFYHSLA